MCLPSFLVSSFLRLLLSSFRPLLPSPRDSRSSFVCCPSWFRRRHHVIVVVHLFISNAHRSLSRFTLFVFHPFVFRPFYVVSCSVSSSSSSASTSMIRFFGCLLSLSRHLFFTGGAASSKSFCSSSFSCFVLLCFVLFESPPFSDFCIAFLVLLIFHLSFSLSFSTLWSCIVNGLMSLIFVLLPLL